ncbi:unnamed protein product [Penicillium salamii]|uniref:MARVEL domain-containing protein n=1 Tax=Penicillium salamii TaxID=1612424 RepID=A0A9W4IHA7_9EURO|nr:unnamed protein product [Penicillium salamii]CAG8283869.1 unnamed protein product [Penicillium salamii]CAG8398362.1 unnamed protein product [Penicillium salamii]
MISYIAGVRVVQMVFGIIIFSLSLSLAKGQVIESVPSETIYAVFAGGLGVVAALLGNAAITDSSLNGPLLWIVDGVTALALFVGGVIFAVRLHGTKCSSWLTTYQNILLSGGCEYEDLGTRSNCWYDSDHLKSRCAAATAATVFMFLASIVCIGGLVTVDTRGTSRGWRPIWQKQMPELKVEK